MPQKKWTNADLAKVSKFGQPELNLDGFQPEEPNKPLDLEGFQPLETVDLSQTPYTGKADRQPVQAPKDTSAGQDVWTELNRPRTNIRQYTERGANAFDAEVAEATKNLPPWLQKVAGFAGKYYSKQGKAVGNFADSLSSDLGFLQMIPASKLMGIAPKAAQVLHNINRAAGAGFAVEGGRKLLNDQIPWDERAAGLADIFFGGGAALHKLPTPAEKPAPTQGERLTGEFNKRVPPPNGPGETPPIDFGALRQPNLQAVDNGPLQLDLLEEKNPFTSSARQQPLVPEQRPTPFTDTAQQMKLDLTPTPVRLPNEFLPDNSFESKLTPEQQGAPRSLFEKPDTTNKRPPDDTSGGEGTPSPFPQVPNDVLDEMIANRNINYNNPRLEDVPLSDLHGTQPHVFPDAVQDYVNQGDRERLTEVPAKARGRMDDSAPVVIRAGGKNILAGGHHRAAADLARGKDSMQSVVYDAELPDDLLKKLQESVQRDKTQGPKRPVSEEMRVPTNKELADFREKRRLAKESVDRPTNDISEEPDYFPKEMRAIDKPENVALGPHLKPDDRRLLDVFTRQLYSREAPATAAKELLQNAIDELKISGSDKPIRALFNHTDKNPITGESVPSLHIGDQGRGLTKEQIYTVLTDVGKTGKADDVGAAGGFGVAKASPMAGGELAEFESVVDEGGKRMRYTFRGTPEELKNQEIGVPIKEEVVSPRVPTGFRAKVWYKPEEYLFNAIDSAKNIASKSMGLKTPLELSERHSPLDPAEIEEFFRNGKYKDSYYNDRVKRIDPSSDLPKQATINLPGADVDIHYDTPAKGSKAQRYSLDLLNNGMWQWGSNDSYSQRGALKEVPENIKANIRATVKEGETHYPYTLNREQVASHITVGIKDWIKKNLIEGARDRQKQELKDMYDQMHSIPEPNANAGFANRRRPSVIFDPDNLLDPQELKQLTENGFIHQFATTVDEIVARALGRFKGEGWPDKIEKVGISLNPEHHGVWIPNPEQNGKATILLNPFNFIDKFKNNPTDAALEMMSTAWHEVGHTGEVINTPIDWSKVDNNDPGIGDFFKKYLDEVHHASAVGDSGHGLDWLRATAEVYARSGVKRWNEGVEGIFNAFTDNGNYLGYSKEVQNALRVYQARAGRVGTEENILSRTGVSEKSIPGESESIFGDAGSNGERPVRPTSPTGENLTTAFNEPIKWSNKVQPPPAKPTKQVVNRIQQEGNVEKKVKEVGDALKQAKQDNTVTRDEKEKFVEKLLNAQRTILTSADLSAPGRQGLALIHRKEWWTSWKPMFEALGSDKGYETVMDSIKQDPTGFFEPNAKGKSFANEAGLSLTDTLDHREELFRSKWAEDFAGTKWFVKPSVRAYTAYLNKLRADTFKNMVKAAGAENNLVDAKAIADYINVATGRGNLGEFDPAGKALAQIFFSPRLTASRLQMYTRTFNPFYYASVPKEVRINQLKSALSVAGAGLIMGQLAKGIGATVNLNEPDNTDFGKIKFGDTRIDPFGGHQQFLVAAARLAMGQTTSSTSGKTTSLTSGKFGMPTRASVFGNFMKNKLAPVPAFVWAWMEGKEFDGKPFDAKQELMNKTVPIVVQDLYDIWKDDPQLLQGLFSSASAFIGGGVQTYGR